MTRILVVDDHPVWRMGLRCLLATKLRPVEFGEAGAAAEAIRLATSQEWHMAVLDVSMPGRGGIDILRDMRRLRPAMPVLMVSLHPEERFAVRALRAGAAGYVTKDSPPDVLVAAVRKALRGGKYVTPTTADLLVADLNARPGDGPPHLALSDREFEILTLIASGRRVGEIAGDLRLSVKTVSTHRANLLRKMSLPNNAQLTAYAVREGLV